MRYYRLFSFLTYLSVLLGVGAVAASERRGLYLLITLIACAAAWRGDTTKASGVRSASSETPARTGTGTDSRPPLPWAVRSLIAGGLLSYAIADYLVLGANAFVSLAHLLNFTIVVKLTAKKGPRDYLQIYLMALFTVIVAGYISAHVLFGVVLVAFVLVTGWAMMLLVMAGEAGVWTRSTPDDYAPRTLDPESVARLDGGIGVRRRRFLGRTAGYTPALLVPAVLVFLLVPRGRVGRVLLPSAGRYRSITGFSDRVQLGEMTDILESADPVMRVELIDPETNERMAHPRVLLLWRGITLDEYRKQRTWGWRKSVRERQRYVAGRDIRGMGDVPPRDLVVQRIWLEPIDSRCLFALAPLVRLTGTENVGAMRLDPTDFSLQMVNPPARVRQYDALSARRAVLRYPPGWTPHRRYLAVPAAIRAPLRRHADRIAPPDRHLTAVAKASAMVRHFRSGQFRYSLAYRGTPGAEPVTDFLTNTRRGHCELFASAMALMLRTQGVHTRLVNGFRGGEWNALGQFLVVQQQDAHSWVEAYLPGQGWRAFDPTPGSPMPRPMRGDSLLGYVRQSYEYLKWSWMQHVLQYDRRRQRRVLRVVSDAATLGRTALAWNRRTVGRAWTQWERIVRRAIARMGLPAPAGTGVTVFVTVVVALVIATPLVLAVRRLRRRRALPAAPVAFYQTLLRLLARWGFTRRPAQTPMEFADSVAAAEPERLRLVPWITQQYYHARFGGRPLADSARRAVRDALAQLAAVSAKPPPAAASRDS